MKVLLSLAACIAFLLVLPHENAIPETAKKAPPFALNDIDGNTVSLSDFQDRVVILDFWATWCHECEESSPELEKVYRKYKDKGLILLGISLDEGSDAIEKVRAFRDKFNLTSTILMGDSKVANAYKIRGIPTTYVLDKNHDIVARFEGALFRLGDMISLEIEQLL